MPMIPDSLVTTTARWVDVTGEGVQTGPYWVDVRCEWVRVSTEPPPPDPRPPEPRPHYRALEWQRGREAT